MRTIRNSVKAKNAVSVHRFLVSIPLDVQRHIFLQILDDAYSQSEFLPDDESLDQFLRAMAVHYYKYRWPVSELCGILFPAAASELAALMETGNINQLYSISEPNQSLPSIKTLFKEFRFFSIQDTREGYTEGGANNLESIIAEMLNEASDIGTKPKLNAFEKIGYLTLMENIFSKRDLIDLDNYIGIFERWYCEGQILDVIFDTIYNSKNTSIKRILWNCLVDACLQDHILCNVVNERWKDFVRLNTLVPQDSSYRFKTKEESKKEEFVEPLGILEGYEPIDYANLYYYLVNDREELKEDECSLEEFKAVFSKSQKKVKRITFHCKNEKRIGSYIYCLFKIYEAHIGKEYTYEDFIQLKCRKSLKFMKKRGKREEVESEYKKNTFRFDNIDETELKRKFTDCGFKFGK